MVFQREEVRRVREKVENKDFTRKELGFIAGTFVFLIYLATYPFFGRLFADIIGFVYPAYKSFQALNYRAGGYEKRKSLLIYWVVLSIFYVFECISRTPEKVRYYYILRSIITLVLYLPQTRGAEIIYNDIIRVVLKHNEKSIDKAVKKISKNFMKEE